MPPSVPPSLHGAPSRGAPSHGSASQGWPSPSAASRALPARPVDAASPAPPHAPALAPATRPATADGVQWSPAALLLARLQELGEGAGARRPASGALTGNPGAPLPMPSLPPPGSPQAREVARALLQRLAQMAALAGVRPPAAGTFVVDNGRIAVAAGWPDGGRLQALVDADARMQALVRALHAVAHGGGLEGERARGGGDAIGRGGPADANRVASGLPDGAGRMADGRVGDRPAGDGPAAGVAGTTAPGRSGSGWIGPEVAVLASLAAQDRTPRTDGSAGEERRGERLAGWSWPAGWTDGRARDAQANPALALRYWTGVAAVLGGAALWWWLAG